MHPIPFTAASAEEAVAQIRAKLGPEAVVLNVRQLPQNGLARLWQKPLIEVLAYLPEAPAPAAPPLAETLAEFRQQLDEIKQKVENQPARTGSLVAAPEIPAPVFADESADLNTGKWRIGPLLRRGGLLPLPAQQVLDRLHAQYGEKPPPSLGEEIKLVQSILATSWRSPAAIAAKSMHLLVGPAGSGKTTCLCKWLTQQVLMDGRTARVWRLDSATANTAESLSVYCDILGAHSERSWRPGAALAEDVGFIDLPGVDWRKPLAIKELAGQIKQFGSPKVHLVLNGAYDVSILLAQTRAFQSLPIEDLVITHLDEEPRWGKVWNLVLGTNFSVRCFSTGQNIPGDFHAATPEMLFTRQFPR
jgi:flagellar biosynthesis protein FlhF